MLFCIPKVFSDTTVTDNFSTNDGMWTYYGNAYLDTSNQQVVLTQAVMSQAGAIWFNEPVGNHFTLSFSYMMGGGTGADGIAVNFYGQNSYTAEGVNGGGQLGFPGDGYAVELDTWLNPEYNDPSNNYVGLIENSVSNHIDYNTNVPKLNDDQWHTVQIQVTPNSVTVSLDSTQVLQYTGTIDQTYSGFGFSGATGADTDWHVIKDVSLTYPVLEQSTTSISFSANPVNPGTPVTVTAAVKGNNPTGIIDWQTNSSTGTFSAVNSHLSNGFASVTYTDLFSGPVEITATYGGDTNNSPSSTSGTLVINPTQIFGNTNWNTNWNNAGGIFVASQFNLQQSATVFSMSINLVDETPPTWYRLGIFSDSNNIPYECLASTAYVLVPTTQNWYSLPLSTPVTLQPGNYWLAEIDSGAGVLKFLNQPGNTQTVYSTAILQNGPSYFEPGAVLSSQLTGLGGTLAIYANVTYSAVPYAEGAQCWTSASSSSPYPIQTTFSVGETVYVNWLPFSPATGAVNIYVYSPGSSVGASSSYCAWIAENPKNSPVSFVPSEAGEWIIYCNGYSDIITVTPVYVFPLPEYALGALLSIISCLAALGLFSYLRKKELLAPARRHLAS